MTKIKIAYLSGSDPTDKKVWSGTHYSIFYALQKHVGSVTILGPYQPKFGILIGKIITGISQLLTKKRYNYRHSYLLAKYYGHYFNKKLQKEPFDLIIAPAALCELAYIKTKTPIVYISDATINLSLNYHKALTGLLKCSEKETRNIEKMTFKNSSKIIVSSNWALNSLKKDYQLNSAKIANIPFGANMSQLPGKDDLLKKTNSTICRLLFIGVYWESKGGEIAFNCLTELLKLGVNAELTICGCNPPKEFKHEKMNVIPFINKNSEEGTKKIYDVFLNHDFLILPTRFDCTPIVICEASAFGLPALIANTGGVAGHLHEGKNGYLIDYNDTGLGYAKKIQEIYCDAERFNLLRQTTREEFDDSLNWDHYGLRLKEIITSILSNESNT